ncbi:growth factor receptor-bound protein 10-like [Neolamprologus brichardi]|uniref:growth factor receptor-bound protein 10-like n=1 Tax=Neolamprologus brichardi TaxID=32507 RepID=UPI001643857F|nr:growth factor receptor-bound protein 10-like [Neolamprologus brichardi]
MALAGCPDYFLRHSNYQERMDRTSTRRPDELIVPGFQRSASQNLPHHHDDDVDLEQLVNDMNSSMESVYSTQTDTAVLLNNGHAPHHHHQVHSSYLGHSRRHTPALPSSSPSRERLRHSQPMHIKAVRNLQEEHQLRPASLPAIPNPFPELCSLTGSPILSPIQTSDNHNEVSRVSRMLWTECRLPVAEPGIRLGTSAGRISLNLLNPSAGSGKTGALFRFTRFNLVCPHSERCVEDHELVVQVQASMSGDSKFLFRKNYAKYEFFRNPLNFFPEQMVAFCQESDGSIPPSQLLQNFLNSSSCPEIQGYLHVKEPGRKSWKKLYMFLRRSGLYYSTKGTSKEPRHLQVLSDLEDSNVFTVITGRKLHNAPTDYQFCIKPSKVRSDCKELKMLCAEDEQSRTCWMTAFRLFKYGIVLYQSYNVPQQRKSNLSPFTAPVRSVSENSLVAMDFSGRTGRVIDNPIEAQSAALEEGHTWRKRSQRMNVLGSPSPLHPSSLSTVIHRTQVWFHGRIMREEAHKMMIQQGQVDGLFLLRDSQSNPKAFVLTLCHHQKIKHFQILPCEEDGQVFFSLDDGATKFTDLIHLVEFYQLNRGVLPCKLKHPCTAVAL